MTIVDQADIKNSTAMKELIDNTKNTYAHVRVKNFSVNFLFLTWIRTRNTKREKSIKDEVYAKKFLLKTFIVNCDISQIFFMSDFVEYVKLPVERNTLSVAIWWVFK